MRWAQARLRDEAGQGMAEYVVLLFGCMLGLLVLLTPMRNAVHTYVKAIYWFVALPFP